MASDGSGEASRAPHLKRTVSLTADIWNYFWFSNDEAKKELDKSKAICEICQMEAEFCGNTTNLRNHMQRHHQDIMSEPTRLQQKEIKEALQLPASSPRTNIISKATADLIYSVVFPYSVVENCCFGRLIKVCEPHYIMVTGKRVAEQVIPNMYGVVKEGVKCKLQSAERLGITSDTWTSVATESYMSVTAHYIDEEWNLISNVLQTTEVTVDHRSARLAEMLTKALEEWGLMNKDPVMVTDNAANIVRAVQMMGLTHIDCFAHIINLASQAGLNLPLIARLLGRVRQIVSFFHRSATASRVLKEKQKLLQLKNHKLTIDVVSRWNSALDMLERFLEQQPAISAALLAPEVRRNETDLCTLKEEDITNAEDVVRALKPMKTATQVMSEEKSPTLSVIAPLHALLMKEMTSLPGDSRVVKHMKDKIKENLSTRYVNQRDMLHIASAVDPRFKALPFLTEEERESTFSRLQTEVVDGMEEEASDQVDADITDEAVGMEPEVEPQPPTPKESSALESLLGEAYSAREEGEAQKSQAEKAADEIKRYRSRRPAGLQDNPLAWWRENETEYPLLARMAKRYLCVPGTSVATERVFSTAACTENLTETDVIRSSLDPAEEYKMDNKRRGLALIFNQEHFQDNFLEARSGTKADGKNLKKRLTDLKFEVRAYDDLEKKEVKERIKEAAGADHSDADCFLLVFLSHGNDDYVFAKDGKIRIQDITSLFKGDKCRSLVGKPKIFIFQACRGNKCDDPVTACDAVASELKTNEVVVEASGVRTLPAGADFIMCYSVAEGYVSYRETSKGSWYIQDLCELLQEYGNSLEFTVLLTLVNRKVSMRSVTSDDPKESGKKQVPCFASMLTKKLYFQPKK